MKGNIFTGSNKKTGWTNPPGSQKNFFAKRIYKLSLNVRLRKIERFYFPFIFNCSNAV